MIDWEYDQIKLFIANYSFNQTTANYFPVYTLGQTPSILSIGSVPMLSLQSTIPETMYFFEIWSHVLLRLGLELGTSYCVHKRSQLNSSTEQTNDNEPLDSGLYIA